MSENSKIDAFGLVTDVLLKLTWNRVFLSLASVVVYAIYENREKVFPLALSSPTLMGVMGGGLAITIGTFVIKTLVMREFSHYEKRLLEKDEQHQAHMEEQDSRIRELTSQNQRLERDVQACRIECETTLKQALHRIELQLAASAASVIELVDDGRVQALQRIEQQLITNAQRVIELANAARVIKLEDDHQDKD